MNRYLVLVFLILLNMPVKAQQTTYYCTLFTQLTGARENPVFRFVVNGSKALLSYNYRPGAEEEPQEFEIPLDVLNDSSRSLVLGALTEGNAERAPRYDVWVLDKNNMQLISEINRSSDQQHGRLERKSGTCLIEP